MAYTDATVAAADTYLAWSADWTAATTAVKNRALDAGEFALESAMTWDDDVTAGTTADIVNASIELALADVQGLLYTGNVKPVVQEEQIGPLKRVYRDAGGDGRGHLFTRFPKVKDMVEQYGTIKASTKTLLRV